MIRLVFLILMAVLNAGGENITAEEAEQIKSLNEVPTLQIFGDIITIVAKNQSEVDAKNCDVFESYLQSHLVRIRSPLQEEKYLDFELNDLIPGNEIEETNNECGSDDEDDLKPDHHCPNSGSKTRETIWAVCRKVSSTTDGREKRDKRKGAIRDLLVPLLLALKYKSTVVLPLLMMMITFVAFKGFWAGMTGLVISKVVGLKVLLQYLKKDEGQDESQDDDQIFYGFPQENDDETDRSDKPVVIYLQSYNKRRKISKRHEKLPGERHFHRDTKRRQQDYRRTNWINGA